MVEPETEPRVVCLASTPREKVDQSIAALVDLCLPYFRAQGLQVGVVDAKGVVEVRDVKVGRDFGTTSEILGSVTASDRVIIDPSDSLTSGTKVEVNASQRKGAE